jgi:hypothetical protein
MVAESFGAPPKAYGLVEYEFQEILAQTSRKQ